MNRKQSWFVTFLCAVIIFVWTWVALMDEGKSGAIATFVGLIFLGVLAVFGVATVIILIYDWLGKK